MADLRINVGAKDSASGVLKGIGSAASAMGASFAAFAAYGVKAFADSEQASRRLSHAVGSLADSFESQASSLERSLGVSQENVMAIQAMLYRYGEAPDKIDATVRAILDYSAATGTDAVSATESMIGSVETGKRAFKDLGLSYSETGSKSEVLSSITDALAGKIGGSAESDAGSLAGRTRIAKSAIDDLAKSLGALLVEAESSTGALKKAQVILDELTHAVSGGKDLKSKAMSAEREANLKRTVSLLEQQQALQAQLADLDNMPPALVSRERRRLEGELEGIRLEISGAEKEREVVQNPNAGKPSRARDGAAKLAEERARAHSDALESARKNAREIAEALAEGEDAERRALESADAEQSKADDAYAEAARRRADDEMSAQAELASRMLAAASESEEAMRRAGAAVGVAFVGAISSVVEQAASGEGIDVASTLIGSISSIASTVLSFIPGASALAPLVGAAGGALANAVRRRHEGGWVEAPRFHDGAWVGADEQPAILQSGERVLSRSEVGRMGGPGAVDASARSSSGPRITVNALDGSTAREYFERAGGRALLNAVRTGRGATSILFGG